MGQPSVWSQAKKPAALKSLSPPRGLDFKMSADCFAQLQDQRIFQAINHMLPILFTRQDARRREDGKMLGNIGLERAHYKGEPGFERYVGCCVVSAKIILDVTNEFSPQGEIGVRDGGNNA